MERPRAFRARKRPLFPRYAWGTMTIVPFLEDSVFGPQDIQATSTALEDICKILNLADEGKGERELLAKRIIALAQPGRAQCCAPA